MNPITTVIAVALTFGICYFVDKSYTKLFRSKQQHKTGLQVRLSKRYASIGLILCILGILAVFTGFGGENVLLIGGGIVIFIGFALTVHYMSFGIFYDADSFILSTFGNKSVTYTFGSIHLRQHPASEAVPDSGRQHRGGITYGRRRCRQHPYFHGWRLSLPRPCVQQLVPSDRTGSG